MSRHTPIKVFSPGIVGWSQGITGDQKEMTGSSTPGRGVAVQRASTAAAVES